ncbi:MAG: VWA domain-containing protein [Anaerobutyricum hallii]|uniref:vWA domain-containing protein n=1 Tax=Anaerobutyricum hallii TaxID=39488 RepID=UPI001DBB3ADD|nr:VWA domain-containing protein [Anaerobutyricum hallii]MBS7167445.1 VWA domain-containing protein [Anaerobutyricum hallii]
MWKKVKRILSCMLALILLLSLIDGQQFFVRAESEVKATQTEQASNKMEETETSSGKEEGSEANNKENGKQEEGTQKEELSTKATEKTTETKNEDGKVDKPDNLNKENENNGQENGGKNEEKETGDKGEETTKEKAEEASAEEDTAQETEAKKQIDATDDTQERTNQQDENVPAMAQRGTDVSEKETEYVPKSQPQGVSIKVYAKENVFPEGTTMTVKELTNKELDSAQNVLEKGNVSYDGFLGYDISFYNKEGKEIEPEEGSVRVEVDMNLNLLPKDLQMDTLQIQHLKEEKKDRTVETVAKAADHKLSVSKSKVTAKFEVKSFSDFILTWNIDATPADPLETGDNAVSIEKQINHEKYATLRDDGTYDLTLTVAGKKGTETNKAKLDVIYILDKSGSMKEDFGGTSKRIAASNAITALTKSLKQNANIDARFSMVTFSGNKTTGMWGQGDTKTWDDAEVAVSWTTDAGTIERGSKPTSNGGTNYQAGIRTAKELLTSKRAGAMTAVIFISDGDPTFYYNPDGYTRGDGNNDGNGGADNLKVCLDAAKNEIANLGVNYFYTVGVGKANDYVNLSDLCSASGVSGAKNFDGTNTDELTKAFSTIESDILTFLCSNVSIQDVLSENVEVVKDKDGVFKSLKIVVTGKDGKTIVEGDNKVTFQDGTQNVTLKAGYDSKTKTITLDFPAEYQLNAEYTYKVIANIDATEKAYENYRKNLTDNKDENEKGYKDAADAGTGTHAGKKGMYTNENSEAKMTYTFRGEEYTELYDKPVIKLHPGKLILEKEVEGLDSLTPEQLEQYKANLKFKIKVKTKNDTSLKEEEITLTAFAKESNGNEDSGSDSNTNRRNKYIYTVMEGIDPGSFYEITEDGGEVEGYTWETTADKKSENGTIAKDETEKVSFKNTYSRKKFPLIINKTVEGNMSEKRKEFAFSITLKDANGAAYELSDEEIKDVGFSTKGENQKGVYTFTLKDGESKEFSLPYGCKYTISEEDYSSSGYKTYIGEKKEENQKRMTEEETLTQKTEINFLNKKEVIPPTGVETTMTAWLLMTGVTLLLGAVFLLFGIRRKRFVA